MTRRLVATYKKTVSKENRMNSKTDWDSLVDKIDSEGISALVEKLRDLGGDELVETLQEAAASEVKKIQENKRLETVTDFKEDVIKELANLEKKVFSVFGKNLKGDSEQIKVEAKILVKNSGPESAIKIRHSKIRSPFIWKMSGEEMDRESFVQFGKRTYRRRDSDSN
jgi:hypothetical protein